MTRETREDLSIDLTPDVREALRFERYDARPRIAGVELTPLSKHRGESGWFLELYRLDRGVAAAVDDGGELPLRQVSVAWADPGRMNAFHIHPKRGQTEAWTVVRGELLVWLVDCRRDSETAGARASFVLSGEAPARLIVPAGVAHGYRAGTDGALLVYGSDRQFDRDDPDEGRLPWNHFGAELWEPDRG